MQGRQMERKDNYSWPDMPLGVAPGGHRGLRCANSQCRTVPCVVCLPNARAWVAAVRFSWFVITVSNICALTSHCTFKMGSRMGPLTSLVASGSEAEVSTGGGTATMVITAWRPLGVRSEWLWLIFGLPSPCLWKCPTAAPRLLGGPEGGSFPAPPSLPSSLLILQ